MLKDKDAHLIEIQTGREELFKGRFLHAFCDAVRLPDGRSSSREYLVHPGAVMVIPLLYDLAGKPRLVLERQYRYPVEQVMIEFPAGKLEPGEDRLVCARRELKEETGYSAREWARAGVIHPVISYSTEFIEIWFARSLKLGERQLDAGEFLDAVKRDDELAVELYVAGRGVNLNARDSAGSSALDIARSRGNRQIAALLAAAQAR